jgi:hypothetical protein
MDATDSAIESPPSPRGLAGRDAPVERQLPGPVRPRAADFLISQDDIKVIPDPDPKAVWPQKLGNGAFATAYAAYLRRDTKVAVKILEIKGGEDAKRKVFEALAKEVEVWQTLTDDHGGD